jgi:hypothetical protein
MNEPEVWNLFFCFIPGLGVRGVLRDAGKENNLASRVTLRYSSGVLCHLAATRGLQCAAGLADDDPAGSRTAQP